MLVIQMTWPLWWWRRRNVVYTRVHGREDSIIGQWIASRRRWVPQGRLLQALDWIVFALLDCWGVGRLCNRVLLKNYRAFVFIVITTR
jgi:hypothetical protein